VECEVWSAEPRLERVVRALNEIHNTRLVWPKGLLHPGGPHRKLAGMMFPISIGEDECRLFGNLIEAFRPADCFIIGNAFGLSSCYIAAMMRDHGGRSVVTLDSEQEGDGATCGRIARELAARLELDLLTNVKGRSPEDIGAAAQAESYDLIFIDGAHIHPQVTKDYIGITPYLTEQTVVVWHDYWLSGIHQSVARATAEGMRCLWVPTSCEMVVGTRDPERFERLRALFPQGVENPKPHTVAIWLAQFVPWRLRMKLAPLYRVRPRTA
jgi:predicted O-methyltransferase YrrM